MNKVGVNQLVHNYMILVTVVFHAQQMELAQETNLVIKMPIATTQDLSVEAHTSTALLPKYTVSLKTNVLNNLSVFANPPMELGFQDLALNANLALEKDKNAQDGKKA